MPQRGARSSPEADLRAEMPACINAAATLVPSLTDTALPLIVRVTVGIAEIDRSIEIPKEVDCNLFCILRTWQEILSDHP
jgi:hypothetical protein